MVSLGNEQRSFCQMIKDKPKMEKLYTVSKNKTRSWRWFRSAAAKSLQSCPTLCDPIDGSPPGFPVPGILQARTLEWVAISFSNAWKWKVKVKSLSCVWLFTTSWTVAYQAPPSMGFPRLQKYCSGVPLPSPIQGWMLSKLIDIPISWRRWSRPDDLD